MSHELTAVAAGVAGLVIGALTHRLNQWLARIEPEATTPPLPGEALLAPAIDALALAALTLRYGLSARSLAAALVIVLLVQVTVFDLRHRLILNRVMYPAIAIALVASPVNGLLTGSPWQRVESAVFGAVLAGGLFFVIVLASRGGVGMGDAKLSFFIGASLGLFPVGKSPTIRAVLYGVILGGVIAAVLLLTRLRGRRDFIPYGPYLCAGAVLELFLFL